MSDRGRSAGPVAVEVGFAGPAPQNRLTVAFRVILMVPHLILLWILGVLVGLAVLVGWFTALFLGRLPDGLGGFIGGVVRYGTRVYAYGYLLTDRYPPFGLRAPDYPVDVHLQPTSLNRWAVLFRLVLQVPAYVVSALLGMGLSLTLFFVWLIVLVSGRMPASLHQAVAASLRYQTRYYAYLALVSPAYPAGLFGDRLSGTTGPGDAGAFPSEAPGSPGGQAPAPWAEPVAPLATTIVLSRAARRLVGLFLALGLVWAAGYAALFAVRVGRSVGNVAAEAQLSGYYDRLNGAVSTFQADEAACQRTGAGLSCEQAAVQRLSPYFAEFHSQLRSVAFPSAAALDAARLESDSDQVAGLLDQMGAAGSGPAYLGAARRFAALGARFDQDHQRLVQDLI